MMAEASGHAHLEIHLLGAFRLLHHDRELPAFPTTTAKLLFSYLVLHGDRRHLREALAGLFWDQAAPREARRLLRKELWRLRRTLAHGTEGAEFLLVTPSWVRFDASSSYWLDVEVFEQRVRQVSRLDLEEPGAIRLLEEAAELYTGDLLEGEYATWSLLEQDRLRALRLELLERLFEHYVLHRRWRRAIRSGQELLRHDPLVEHVHRQMMAVYYLAGDRPKALRQFRSCSEILKREFAERPMQRTVELHRALQDEDVSTLGDLIGFPLPRETGELTLPKDLGSVAPARGDEALAALRDAAADLSSARTRLLRGLKMLSRRSGRPVGDGSRRAEAASRSTARSGGG